MRAREYLLLFALAALWGASFLFIRVAVAELSPVILVEARFVIATLGLLLVVSFRPTVMKGWHTHWWPDGERITWGRLVGVALGLFGVAIVIGPTTLLTGGSVLFLLGAGSILLGAVSYAFGGLFAHSMLSGLPSILPALGQTAMGACILAPIAGIALMINSPLHLPSTAAIAAVLALALGGTTLAYICFYWLIDHVGPTRTVIVTYLLPCMAVVYGALLLHEALSLNALGGLAFVLLGIFLGGRRTALSSPAQSHIVHPALGQATSEERNIL